MGWSDWGVWLLAVAVAAILVLYLRLMLKNHRLRQLADEANRLRREATEEQERNRKLKQEMTSNIAHELKTPVSSIRGYLEILLGDRPIDDERRRFYLDRCFHQTLRLSDLIKDVSLINKLEESADLFPKEEVNVRDIAQEAVDELAGKAAERNITVDNLLPQQMPIRGSHELLYCIFRNLIENALEYAGEGCRVAMETYRPDEGGRHYIHFYDTGRGVADEYLSRLFDRFVRIDEGRSRRNGGTGLGLSIVKHAVLFHGGEIYAKNRQEGGLEFFFSLCIQPENK